jgi:hypothetical protein
MKKHIYLVLSLLIVGANLFVPACGSKNNSSAPATPPYPGPIVTCTPGQFCPTSPGGPGGGGVGVPLLPAPAIATNFDNYGSTLVLNFLGQQVVAGQYGYNGPVGIQGILTIRSPYGGCPAPGDYQVVGQGTYLAGYAAADAGVGGTLQITGQNGASGTATLDSSSIHNINVTGVSSFIMGMQLQIPSCNRILSTPYN